MHFRHFTFTLAAVFFSLAGISRADQLQAGDFVAICGDSITEQRDYSVDIELYLLACRPAGPIRAAQFGWNSDTAQWFEIRGAKNHVLALKPTIVTTCFGMNDAGFEPIKEERIALYRERLTKVVRAFKAEGVRQVVVGSPGAADSDNFAKSREKAAVFNKNLATLRDVAKEIAQQNDCLFANVHDPMIDAMAKAKQAYGPKYHVGGNDGVHPWDNGHLVMAYAFLKAMGCEGEIGTISLDLAAGRATASEGHKVLSSSDRSVDLESARYPFCFWGKDQDPRGTKSILPFVPFNEELNRLTLKVTNPTAKRFRVRWGNASGEYTAEQLTTGINLAADFLDNPFTSPFLKLRDAVRQKQEFETILYKNCLTNLPKMGEWAREIDPSGGDAANTLRAALIKRDAKLAADLVSKVPPVKHTITIEPLP